MSFRGNMCTVFEYVPNQYGKVVLNRNALVYKQTITPIKRTDLGLIFRGFYINGKRGNAHRQRGYTAHFHLAFVVSCGNFRGFFLHEN